MRQIAFPYRRARITDVSLGTWQMVEDEAAPLVILPPALAEWDAQTRLTVRQSVHVDIKSLLTSTGLPGRSEILVSVVGRDSGTNQTHHLFTRRIDTNGDEAAVELEAKLDGATMGGVLSLTTRLVLGKELRHESRGVAHLPGSILWERQHQVVLQGAGAQFPMTIASFTAEGSTLPPHSPWHLNISGDMYSAAAGALLLMINEDNKEVTEAFARAQKNPTSAHRAILHVAQVDTTIRMLTHALSREDFSETADYPDDSLGAACLNLLGRTLGNVDVAGTRAILHEDPTFFFSKVQAGASLFAKGEY